MTDEQFKQLMDKLEEIKQAQAPPTYIGHPVLPAPYVPMYPPFQPPIPHQPWDGLPASWRHPNAVD